MHERREEECRVEWLEIEVDGDLWQEGSSKSEGEQLQDSSDVCHHVWFGDPDAKL